MRRALCVALVLAGCGGAKPSLLPVGTRVPIAELRGQPELRRYVAAEIERGHHARAYFALDLMKTRPYVAQRLAGRTVAARLRDLRPLVGELAAPESGRALVRVRSAPPTEPVQIAEPVDAYWNAVALFEQRIAAPNRDTPGLPYAYAARHTYGVSSVEETVLALSPGEALLSYLVAGDRAYGFLVADRRLVVRALPASAGQLRAAAGKLLAAVRDPTTAAWRQPAAELYDALLAPFAAQLDAAQTRALFVSTDDILASVPFAALLEPRGAERRLLVERFPISYIPSASAYRRLIARPILDEAPRVLAVGNASYPPGVPPLPFAGREAVTVSELFPGSLLLAGAAAGERRTVALAPRFNILHFATHGVLLGDIAGDASSLLLSADAGTDGFLNAAEIAALDLSRTYLVVLSACETSVAEAGGNLGSLTNAFLGAGAPSVIGSLWQVEDEATTALMLEFYRRFLERGGSAALREAMIELRRRPRYAHPFYWAAFALSGWDK